MAKKKAASATTKTVALTAEEFQKLTPEEQTAYLNGILEENSTLQSENSSLKKAADATKKEAPSFEVDADEENDIEGGEYQFTCPAFTWDDGIVIKADELITQAGSKKPREAEKAQAILAELIKRRSGIVKRIEVPGAGEEE